MGTRSTRAVLALCSCVPGIQQELEVPRQVRVVAEIDGVDELHLNATEARWVHQAFSMPTRVTINGRQWDPSRRERWRVAESEPFFAPDLDLAGATVTLVRGRGKIGFRHDADGLVLSFDDARGGGAGEYEVVVELADVLCEQRTVVGDADLRALGLPPELRIEAHVDGRDELFLGPRRADWLHLAWGWPESVTVGGRAWEPQQAPLDAPPGTLYFSPALDLARVRLQVEEGRGDVELEVAGERLVLSFDDEEAIGAGDYAVRLRFPAPPRTPAPRLPTGPALRVELLHEPATDVAGAELTVLALSPATGDFVPWPGLRGMDATGRCVLALPRGTYRFEVLHRPAPDRLVALRTGPLRLTRDENVRLPAAVTSEVLWRDGETELELRELAVQSILGDREASWKRGSSGRGLTLVASPGEELSLRAFGAAGDEHVAWWTRRRLGAGARLESSRQDRVRCDFEPAERAALPPDCEGTLHFPRSELAFPIVPGTHVSTNRRFVGFSYRHALADGRAAVFHQRQVLLPRPGRGHVFELGGALSARGSASILTNENLGAADAQELWWELVLVDASGHVLDTQASDVDWRASASMRDGSPLPAMPLDEAALERLGDPTRSVTLAATYRWDDLCQVRLDPAPHVLFENERYRSRVPGHLEGRARAYLDKARRTYRAIEVARARPGAHAEEIEIQWWLNGGAVGAWGSITMPIGGMTDVHDWFSFPWALAHESLHAFGYLHGPELERLDREAIRLFERMTWQAELDPAFVPEGW